MLPDIDRNYVRPDPLAQTAPSILQTGPALPHCSSAATLARSTFSAWTSDQFLLEIAKAPQLVVWKLSSFGHLAAPQFLRASSIATRREL